MNTRAIVLARRREALLRRSNLLRRRMRHDAMALQPALVWMDRVHDGVMWLRNNPLVALAGGLGLAVSRPQRWLGLGMRAWSMWQTFKRVRAATTSSSNPRRRVR